MSAPLVVRTARRADLPAVSALTVAVYVGGGFTAADSVYVPELADAEGRAAHTDLLVAELDGRVVGSVGLAVRGGRYAENARRGQAVFRMLAVLPAARGAGVGAALVTECLRRSARAGCDEVLISTQPTMTSAHRLYERLGFRRDPAADWSPRPGVHLWVYLHDLAGYRDDAEPGVRRPGRAGAATR